MISKDRNSSENAMSLAGRSGGDVSARLLLALTVLYAERTNHTADEREQYTELAIRLIDRVDGATRAAVATILRDRDLTPPRVRERLDALQEPDTGRADILSPDSAALHGLSHVDDPGNHRMTAAATAQDTLAPTFHPTEPLAIPPPQLPVEQAPFDLHSAERESAGGAHSQADITASAPAAELAKAFFAAAPTERLLILAQIGSDPDAFTTLGPDETKRRCDALDVAAMEGRIGEFIREFERLLGVPKSLCERIVNDISGEPMVVAAKAVNMPAAVLQRILLLVNPAVGRSVQRVFHLTDLFHDLDRATAAKLLSLWRAEAPPNPEVHIDISARKPREAGAGDATGFTRRFGALGERIGELRRSAPESVARRDHRSR